MRRRATFLYGGSDTIDLTTSVRVAEAEVTGPNVLAGLEEKLTLSLDELPAQLRRTLESTSDFHLRWACQEPYTSPSPLLARLTPGLHLFYTPRSKADAELTQTCDLLKDAFGPVDCLTPKDSFTTLPHDRFSQSTAYQYYQPVQSLADFVRYAQKSICSTYTDTSCAAEFTRLNDAASLDISYDVISHALRITAVWPPAQRTLSIASTGPTHRTEVGILANDAPKTLESHELGLSGVLAVLGQDTKPSSTLFTFPSRHRHVEGSGFSATVLSPIGLHPTLQLTIHTRKGVAPVPLGSDNSCALHAYFTLPSTIFADKYQLSDPLFMASKNLTALRFITQPVDLEAPEYAVKTWGSAVLLELAPLATTTSTSSSSSPSSSPADDDDEDAKGRSNSWTAQVPLHLRYLTPASGGYSDIEIPYPAVFWACHTEEGTKFSNNPFDRVHVGYDGLFGPRTAFWHVDPAPAPGTESLVTKFTVPVLDLDKSQWVGAGTAVVVTLGFAWVCWKLLLAYIQGRSSGGYKMVVGTKKEQ